MIKAISLTKKYKDELIFEDLNFCAKEGEFTIIQGDSGSGKTTLLNLISTIDKINKDGKLNINTVSIENLTEHERSKFRAKEIGFIFQSYALIPEFTIIENCTIPLIMQGKNKKDAIKLAKEKIKKFIPDINENFFTKKPDQLSGGQQQRVSIARAMIHNPKILIADEPTANLDSKASKYVKDELKKLVKEDNICVIVVTHEKEYENYADKIYKFINDPTKKARSILKVYGE